ncbi:DUF4270 domain-containing protein [Massilibacteroides sp.]|uniref:DUF4270 domain-containing protein n=1 Tax=Massilibacteroides sp. TaxID=2034766 RepID=UPI0026060F7D|nr:DUF4270 domain-containing protein [Massilibacteroides sp.]MDD4516001.1 DUF4270 domain-containing protein [Massilibacteroides sp.]
MKLRSLILGLMLVAGLFTGCNDDMNYVGGTIQPDGDRINVAVDSFMITASTIKIDSIYAKTSTGYLGQFFEPKYGDYKSDYISQFYCQEGFKFAHEPIDGKIDSIKLVLRFSSYIGDSLSPMKAEVFPVIKPLERNYYTNINPEEYCDLKNSLGGESYTIYNVNNSQKLDSVRIFLDKEIGQRIYDETINNPASFANQEAFNRFFPGFYVTNTFGMGAVLEIAASQIKIHYKYEATTTDVNGDDSTYVESSYESFMVTNEVVQMNRMSSYGLDELLQPNDNYTYLKTPAGVYTRIVIPAKKIFEKIGDRIINNVPITIRPLPQNDWEYASKPSDYLLLLPEDSLNTFFQNNKLPDNITSFISSYSYSSTEFVNMYNFSNIARLLKTHKENGSDEDLNLLLIPVKATVTQTSSSSSSITNVQNYQKPSGLTLRKDPEVMSIRVTTSDYEE